MKMILEIIYKKYMVKSNMMTNMVDLDGSKINKIYINMLCNGIITIILLYLMIKKTRFTQLNQLGWKYQRFSAIKHEYGGLGCTLSHIALLEMARDNRLEYIVILEDD